MTVEQAIYFKVLLSNGYTEELLQYVNTALEAQSTLSDVVLELAYAGNDREKLISILSEYLIELKNDEVDFDGKLIDMFLAFFRRKYREENMPIDELVTVMHSCAMCHSNLYPVFDNPLWYTMYILDECYEWGERTQFLQILNYFLDYKKPMGFSNFPS